MQSSRLDVHRRFLAGWRQAVADNSERLCIRHRLRLSAKSQRRCHLSSTQDDQTTTIELSNEQYRSPHSQQRVNKSD